jgi:uncharacterized protein involved in exopolysaccharide biosynthesis
VALANAGANGLISYIKSVNRDPTSAALLNRYRRFQAQIQRIETRIGSINARPRTIRFHRHELRRLNVELQTAQLEAQVLSNRFNAAQANAPTPNSLQLLVPASSASSDYGSMLARLLLIGLAAGAVVGVGLALARANRAWLRHLA